MSSSIANINDTIPKNKNYGKKHPRVHFTLSEDMMLKRFVEMFGTNKWEDAPKYVPTKNMRQCRDRWNKYLNPNIDTKEWTEEEDKLLIRLYNQYGPKWVSLSHRFCGRTDIQLKNRFKILKRKQIAAEKKMKYEQEKLEKERIQESQNEDNKNMDIKDVEKSLLGEDLRVDFDRVWNRYITDDDFFRQLNFFEGMIECP